jgi:hypothetical protein
MTTMEIPILSKFMLSHRRNDALQAFAIVTARLLLLQ